MVGGCGRILRQEASYETVHRRKKRQAIDLYFDQGLTTKEVVDRLGYPTRQNLERWLSKDPRYGGNFRHGFYSVETKTKTVELYTSGTYTAAQIAGKFNIGSLAVVLNWVHRVEQMGYAVLIPRKRGADMPKPKLPNIPDDLDELRLRCEELEMDNYMRMRHFSWDSREKMFVPAAERYSPKLRKNILPLHGTSKTALVISYFDQDGADAKANAKQVGFETHTELASYMKTKGYTWDTLLENYVKSSEETISQANRDENVTLDDVFELVKKLQGADLPKPETKELPRYQIQGMYGTKTLRIANGLEELARYFSDEKSISQRELFEVALIEFFQKHGYGDEVEGYLMK